MNTLNWITLGTFAIIMIISLVIILKKKSPIAKDGRRKSTFFEDANGDDSSTRLKSYLMLLFFFVINMMVFTVILEDKELMKGNLQFNFMFLVFDLLMLLAIFVPSQLNKVSEMKGIIELAKPDLAKNIEANTQQIKAEKLPDQSQSQQ